MKKKLKLGCVLMAAGNATRFGENKLLAEFMGRPLIEHALRAIPKDAFKKAAVITLLALFLVITSTYLIMMLDPNVAFIDALFEMTSAFGTVGLSTGITPDLSIGSKIISILMMYIGRLGPLTIATLWYFSRGENIKYPDGNIAIG